MTNQVQHRAGRAAGIVLGLIVALGLGLGAGYVWRGSMPHSEGPAGSRAAGNQAASMQLWTCSMHPQVIREEPGLCPICHMQLTPLKAGEGLKPGSGTAVTIDPAAVQNMGVRTVAVERGPLQAAITAAGLLREREQDNADVSLRVGGWIERLYANYDGMLVKKGEPLFDLYSPDLTLALDELIAARKAAGRSEGDAKSAAESLRASARAKVIRLGLTPEQADTLGALEAAPKTVTFLSPRTGHLRDKVELYSGTAVASGQRVLRIVDASILWLDARVFESDLSRVKVGQRVSATVDAFPGQAFAGEVSFIYPHLDAATRTATVRVNISNENLKLLDGMYASTRIETTVAEAAVIVPREAVIDTGERQVAFVVLGEGRFEPREVKLGASGDGGVVEVLSGLTSGETVVVSGQFLLDSESRLREAVRKYMDQGPAGSAAGGKSGVPTGPALPPASAALASKIDGVYAAYLPLAAALGAEQTSEKPLDAGALSGAARAMLAAAGTAEDKALAAAVADAAHGLEGRTLAEQRQGFKALGEAMVRLSAARPPSARVAPRVWVMHCPMAPGHWLQASDTIANPFYAAEMKECGEIVREIDTGGAANRGAPGSPGGTGPAGAGGPR